MLAEVRAYRARGYRVHSVKIGSGVAEDVARMEALAADEQPGETIFYDVNRAWLPNVAITVMNAVRHLPVWFEQPCETLEECAVVRASTSHPISLDETITTPVDLLRARDLGAGEIVNIKIGRVGGLTRARRLRDLALELGLGVLVEDTGGTILADTAAAHLASTVPARSLIGTWSCQELITFDPAPGQGARVVEGVMRAPDAPGLGIEIDAEALAAPIARYTARAGADAPAGSW
jgi:L-alanine-DL-glutamate epimerase-like enolase superfamily enzyme